MLIKRANKKIQQRRPFQGVLSIKMHSRLTQWYNINGMVHLNVIFGSYRTIKQAWLQLLQLPDCKCTDDCIHICSRASSVQLAPSSLVCSFSFAHAGLLLGWRCINFPVDASCASRELCRPMAQCSPVEPNAGHGLAFPGSLTNLEHFSLSLMWLW